MRDDRRLAPSVLAGLAALVDILLIRAWLAGDLPMIRVMALHLCLSLMFATAWFLCHRSLSTTLASGAFLILFGPFGGIVAMVLALGRDVSVARQPLPAPGRGPVQPRPHDAAELLFEQISQRRRHPLPAAAVPDFLTTLRSGTLDQQQNAIAAISRNYHPDMRPALNAALASPVPALRVQAAAVYAKLRGTYGSRAKELLARGQMGGEAAPDATACLEVADSGFVDDATRDLLRQRALSPRAVQDMPPPASVAAARPARSILRTTPRLKRYACGGLG
jgi:hypothetical protein